MEKSAAASTSSSAFVRWEEVYVSSDKGRREVHYYLKRRDGSSDLAVIGKEKSLRHMSYHYAIRDRSLLSISSSSLFKLKSRREVIDWLNSIVPDSLPHQSSQLTSGSLDRTDASDLDVEALKGPHSRKLGHHTTEFLWLGSPWTCRKRRKHYQSFCRNGVKISVHDFVFVLAEEDKRLVAYLDDMYEDIRGNKMVVVRWFHRVDEVGICLPHNYNDREIFFSLCLQDLSIECIDGLATVLSPHHYEKFLNVAAHTQFRPFVCHRQFDNDDVKSFDVTQVKGYWEQEIIKYMFDTTHSNAPVKTQPSDGGLKVEENLSDAVGIRPRKRLRRSKDSSLYLHLANKQESVDACLHKQNFGGSSIVSKGGNEVCSVKEDCFSASISGKEAMMQKAPLHLTIGSQVEVLSQDSGMRGCWFRALTIKMHKDKVKVQYQDIKDAADEAKNLEEWISASKVALPDELGIRICGRTTVRPTPLSNKGRVSWAVDVGAIVDVWWHDGWWEGIVVQKETEDRFHVYFPGEKRESTFSRNDLRHSQEWLGNGWKHIKERPDLVTLILCNLGTKQIMVKSPDCKPDQAPICDRKQLVRIVHKDSLSIKDEAVCSLTQIDCIADKLKEFEVTRDLSKDELLARLKWKKSGKRKRYRNSALKVHYSGDNYKSSPEAVGIQACERFFIPTSLNVDHDNCKYVGDSLFGSSVVPPLTSLVMSR